MILAGERVVLRHSRPEDATALARGFADDPAMGALLGIEAEQESEEGLRALIEEDDRKRAERTAFWFTIADPADGVLGQVGLVGIKWDDRRAGVGVFLVPAARKRGLARDAIELIVGWGHGELGLHRIEIQTFPENERMQACAEAAGFIREGVLRGYSFERGSFHDNVVYSRLATDR